MNELEEIKNRIEIVEYVGKYVPLKQTGRNFKGCCPFHNEKTPSFIVSPDKQIWHCFGCNEGGDVITFAEKMEGLDFGEAVKILAERAGVKLPERINSPKKGENDRYFAIMEEACEYYEKELFTPNGKYALDYLKSRGFTEEIIKKFRLGFSPAKGDLLTKHLTLLGYKQEELLKVGITGSKEGRFYDWFRGRLMVPIASQQGKIVAFTARTMEGIIPGVHTFGGKYVNTPETPIYHKGDVLFGFDKAKEFARKQDHLILVEGNMDMIAAFQAGTKNVVATSGTALTENQLNLIKRFTKNIKIAFDIDLAGVNATRRAIEMAQEKGFNIKVIEVPEGKDPADLVKNDPKKWILACKKAKYVVDYIFDSTFEKYNLNNILEKKQATKELLGVVAKLPDPIEKEHYLNIIASRVGVSLQALLDALSKTKVAKHSPVKEEAEKVSVKKSKKTLEEHLLGLILIAPQYLDFFFHKLVLDDFRNAEIRELIGNLQKFYNGNDEFKTKKWLKTLNKNEEGLVNKLTLQAEDEFADAEDEQLGEELFNAVFRLKKENIERDKQSLSLQIKEAELAGDKAKLLQFMGEFQSLIEAERNL